MVLVAPKEALVHADSTLLHRASQAYSCGRGGEVCHEISTVLYLRLEELTTPSAPEQLTTAVGLLMDARNPWLQAIRP
jgi:hypothetical protein